MTQRDEHLWEEEVVEIFLDADRSGHDYYELEISPANVVCDLRMITPSPWKGDFDFNLAGLETRVLTAKDAAGRTTGWTATAFLPWQGLRALPSAARVATPPKPGDRWRFNVFRIERPGGKASPEKDAVEAAWSTPHGPHLPRPLGLPRHGVPRRRALGARDRTSARPRLPRHDRGRSRGRPAHSRARAAGTRRLRTGGSCSRSARASSAWRCGTATS